jgi:signal transduction histidine kinase
VEFYIREARESIRDLRSPVLQNQDLGAALREACERITDSSGVSLEFQVSGLPRRGARKLEENLLRIGHEAVANAVRHAGPSLVRVTLQYDDDAVRLRVEDDGAGFDPELAVHGRDGHWGVLTMRERADQIGGRFVLTSSPGKGTRLEVSAPM